MKILKAVSIFLATEQKEYGEYTFRKIVLQKSDGFETIASNGNNMTNTFYWIATTVNFGIKFNVFNFSELIF